MMTFLNALLLGGAAAAIVPLIIHLLNRSRFKMLDWGAMHLLESAIKINSRRTQWQAWLLLLLRMSIPAILALCLARPVLTAWRTAAGGNQHSVVLIVDNSLSMEAECERRSDALDRSRAAAGTTDGSSPSGTRSGTGSGSPRANSCFSVAVSEAAALIERFGPATEVTILTTGGGVIDQTDGPTLDRGRALRRLRDIRVGAGASAMAEAISAGLGRLSRAKQPRRHLILLSDFQRSEWEHLTPETLAALREVPDASDPPIEVTFIPVAPRAAENLSVQIERPAGASVIAHHQPLEVRVQVRNHGRSRVKNLSVVLTADGDSLASKNVEVAGDSQVFLVFTCQLQSIGTHVLSVSIDEAAARSGAGESPQAVVTTDDVARWSIEVIEPVRVGIVSARPPDSTMIDDATFLNLALSPYAVSLVAGSLTEETGGWAEAHAGADPIRSEISAPEDMTERWLTSIEAVALTNVPALDDRSAERLAAFVENGGLLLVWAGDALQPAWYNRSWGPNGSHKLLPYTFGQLSRPGQRGADNLKIQSQSYDHPALTLFNRSSNGRLDSIDFNTWFQLEEAEPDEKSTAADDRAFNLLVLENGDPLLAERAVGRGRVLQWATSCGERWSNLPLREVFVPLMQQLILYGATASSPRLNLETGQTLALTRFESGEQGRSSNETSSDAAAQPVELLTPQGTRHRLERQINGDQRTVQFARTQFPGTYLLSEADGRTTPIAVSAPGEESVLTSLSSSSLSGIAERLDGQIQPSAAAFWREEMVKQTGREVWRWALAALVACLFVELLLQQSLTRTPA